MAKDLAYEAELAELLELVGDVAESHGKTTGSALLDLWSLLDGGAAREAQKSDEAAG